MAGDWIKMRTNLDTDWRVIEMSGHLGIPELHVVGCLWKLWTWADQHTLDGNAIRVTSVTLDRFTGVTGFADALRKVGWLDGRDNALSFPRFAEHNGQTAKNRAETNKRVARHRNANTVTNVTPKPLPEKRREEKSNTHTLTPAAVDSSLIDLPDWLTAPWQRLLDHLFATTGRRVDSIRAETMVMELLRRGEEKALADIEFTILKGGKSILDSANDFEKRAKRPGGGDAKPKEKPIF